MDITIETVTAADAKELLAIYTPYVRNTAVTFELEPPSLDEFRFRIVNTLSRYPYYAAKIDGRIVGYCYAGALKNRAAYDWSVETSIYVEQSSRHMGVGKKLYAALEETLKRQNITDMFACVASPEKESEFLSFDSRLFHKAMGFEEVGTFKNCGYKFSRWFSMLWMNKTIGEHLEKQPPVIPFSKLL